MVIKTENIRSELSDIRNIISNILLDQEWALTEPLKNLKERKMEKALKDSHKALLEIENKLTALINKFSKIKVIYPDLYYIGDE